MAEVQRSLIRRPTAAGPNGAAVIPAAPTLNLRLPTEPTKAIRNINAHHIVITGEPGVGKTTLGSREPDVFTLSFDPLRISYEIIQEFCPDWYHFEGYLRLLEDAAKAGPGKFPYRRVVVDGCDLWYRACQDKVCKDLVIKHPSEEGWGRGWDMLANTFGKALDRLMVLPCGVWFVCHARDKEYEKRDGTKITKLSPALGSRAEELIIGKAAALFNIHYVGKDRVMVIRGSEEINAKCDINGHFLTPNGDPVYEIVLGNEGPEEAYRRLVEAFNNEQRYIDYAEYQAQTTTTTIEPKKGGPEPKKALMKPKK